ncbi:MAG: hypothetical protein ABI972_25905 [Acidobacteriota bacterium]
MKNALYVLIAGAFVVLYLYQEAEARYRQVAEFLKPSIAKAQNIQRSTEKYPELSAAEYSVISAVSTKAMQLPLLEADLAKFRLAVKSYTDRTGVSVTEAHIRTFTQASEDSARYNYELGRCIISSMDMKQPFESNDLIELRKKLQESGLVRSTKLETDRRMIIAAGHNEPYVDEFDQKWHPPRREEVLRKLDLLEVTRQNFKKMAEAYRSK